MDRHPLPHQQARKGVSIARFADINPVTLTVNAACAVTIGHGDALAPALGTLARLAALLLVFVPLSVRAFRRA